jgi:hypothetical protein
MRGCYRLVIATVAVAPAPTITLPKSTDDGVITVAINVRIQGFRLSMSCDDGQYRYLSQTIARAACKTRALLVQAPKNKVVEAKV